MNKIIVLIILSLFLFSCKEDIEQKNTNLDNNENNMNYSEQFFSQISIEDFKKELEDPEIVLIDVRTPGELPVYWKIREEQLLIDINNQNFITEIDKLDKTKKYLIYCWHWNRSQVARNYMKSKWFLYAKDLKWWIDAWENAWENIIK